MAMMVLKVIWTDLADEKMKFHATLFLERKFLGLLKLADRRGMDLMGFYGVGNHGGGPTIKNLKLIRKLKEEWGTDSIVHSSPNIYFEKITAKKLDIPVIKDDLQHHARGCYSAHSEIKADNPQSRTWCRHS
jgi:alpha-mannosidase